VKAEEIAGMAELACPARIQKTWHDTYINDDMLKQPAELIRENQTYIIIHRAN
jgi:hypothetical protein